METINKPIKTGQISVFVDETIKASKKKSGLTWRSLIIRGLKSLNKNDDEDNELREKIGKLSQKLQEYAVRTYRLEQALNKKDEE